MEDAVHQTDSGPPGSAQWRSPVGRGSTLSRMFNFGRVAPENFTTEALALALRTNAQPLIASLKKVGISFGPNLRIVDTQASIEGGVLDLLLIDEFDRRVAIEVKVGAGEHGDQLSNYLNWIKGFTSKQRPTLVVLSPSPITDRTDVTWLPWQEVWWQIHTTDAGLLWAELGRWLEERGMADRSFEPVGEEEARSLRAAHSLLQKTVHILVRPAQRLNEVWPGSAWPATPVDVKRQLYNRFGTWPSFSIQHKASFKCGCTIGIYCPSGSQVACVSIWVWASPRLLAERDAITKKAAELQSWTLSAVSGELLRADKPLLDFADHEAASKWLIERINELNGVGMYDVFSGSGVAEVSEEIAL